MSKIRRMTEVAGMGAIGLIVAGVIAQAATGGTPRLPIPTTVTSVQGTLVPASARKVAAGAPALDDAENRYSRLMLAAFDRLGYDLSAVANGTGEVPRLTIRALPRDIGRLSSIEQRKELFLRALLPVVLAVNEEIFRDRQALLVLREKVRVGGQLDAAEQAWLEHKAEEYDSKPGVLNALIKKVDEVPVSMALAQAIEESGWGTSRIALDGNALFGQFGSDDRYLVFGSLTEAVRAYARNLNTHRAYKEFRQERATLRHQGEPLDGALLVGGLERYSERGDAYVQGIRAIIRANSLDEFDRARLDSRNHQPTQLAAYR